jgi:magnesium transporter
MGKHRLLKFDFFKRPVNRDIFQFRAKKAGLPPGSLVHVGQQKIERPVISLIDYDLAVCEISNDITIDRVTTCKETDTVSWINLSGIHDTGLIDEFGKRFGIHPLALEDILNTHHRPKIDEYEGYTLIIIKMLFFDEENHAIRTEQVSVVLGSNYVLSFQESEGDVFDGVRDRLQRGNGKIRQRGPDYLAYALLDSIVDSYYQILEKIGDLLVQLEDELITSPESSLLTTIHHYKRELLLLRKSLWPLREVVGQMYKEDSSLIREDTRIYLRDLHDHTVQTIDTLEIYRDTITGLQDLYMSSVSIRMNEIMKVLTVMASIFIPLTFIAGIYGMNFDYMPELKWHWAYFALWGVMAACGAGMLIFFRKKKWL